MVYGISLLVVIKGFSSPVCLVGYIVLILPFLLDDCILISSFLSNPDRFL